ncbi:proteinaceous RNase P 2 isoform X2 [Sorghum bicolor]|uniref:proteinaceous RNase P 2 isoform X2 n=1 Tax=Sorghum bicolor TaxID=4558 RepID=UPI000B4253A5|nr:proteinaceous RNase P 2 isoform X2 [Sorghum bicolor]|eukprot:XP_021307811.1 proteinaceous RNase P 2 isoform X2 [Sorghum bicolor]
MWLVAHPHHGLKQLMGRWRALTAPKFPPFVRALPQPSLSRRRCRATVAVTPMASTATSRRRPRRGSKGPNADLCRTLTDCTRRGDAAAAMAAFDAAVSGAGADADTPLRLAAHQYNQLLHLLASADRSSFPGPAAAAAARRVFAHMLQAGAPPSEATITSLARVIAAADDPGSSAADEAFELVATMKDKYGLSPRLRSYGPVLAAFRSAGEAAKAYAVEAHMTASGVSPEEPELAALLDVSSRAGDADKVYEYMHKLRQAVDCVSEETAGVVEAWFRSDKAAMAGCRYRLACIDIDMEETRKFADSVAGLALERETKTNFSRFQEWLEANKEYQAIVDGANIALYQQNFAEGGFSLTQLDAVITELRDRYHGKWPLVILHNKRIAKLMENSSNRHLIETWRTNGALYTSPSGSNDDWYWLYAAIKLNCLLVTNDEMRDHIFELLGSSFFPKWKQRHRVKYTFNKGKAVLVMPPSYSSEIQESEMGSWHIPMEEKSGDERGRIWLCIGRGGSCKEHGEVPTTNGVVHEIPPTEASKVVQQRLAENKNETISGKRKDRD